jgi:thioredoxin 1
MDMQVSRSSQEYSRRDALRSNSLLARCLLIVGLGCASFQLTGSDDKAFRTSEMPFAAEYRAEEPTRDEIDRSVGLLLLEFGASWCGHCRELSPTLEELLNKHPQVHHLRIADGRGKPLGRSFRVKLWPTLVLLRDGALISQLVRPTDDEVRRAFTFLQS